MKKIMMRLMAILLLFSAGNMIRAMKEEVEEVYKFYAKDIANFLDKEEKKVVSEKVETLATFVLNYLFNTENQNLITLKRVIMNFIDREKGTEEIPETILGNYFVTLLRNQNPYENAAIDIYTPAMQKKLEEELFGKQTWGQWVQSFFRTQRQNVYCEMFDRYVKPLLEHGIPVQDADLKQSYNDFLAQLFILAQQDNSGTCWDMAIAYIKKQEYTKDKQTDFFEAMAKSALINYATLYQANQAAGKFKAKYRMFMSREQSWRYLYFLVTAAQALEESGKDFYVGFIDNLPFSLNAMGMDYDKEAEPLAAYLESAIKNPTFIQQAQGYLARATKTRFAIKVAGTGLLATSAWYNREMIKDFGPKAWEFLQATGSGFMSTTKGYYERIKAPVLKRFQKIIGK